MSKFKQLLCFPGGGVRGCVSLTHVKRLIADGSLRIKDIHSFSGSSTGAMIAAALACGMDINPLLNDYELIARDIFEPRFLPKWLATAIFSAPYSTDRLLGVLKSIFGERKLGEARNLVIVSWNLSGKFINRNAASPLMLHSHKTAIPFDTELQETMPLYVAVAGSCAAPSYFEPVRFKAPSGVVNLTDGGLVSNLSVLANTLICASRNYGEGRIELGRLTALVLGNGTRYFFQKCPKGGWKTPAMIETLIGSLTGTNQIFMHQVLTALLLDNFLNFDPPMPFDAEIDDVAKIPALKKWADDINLAPLKSWMSGYFV